MLLNQIMEVENRAEMGIETGAAPDICTWSYPAERT